MVTFIVMDNDIDGDSSDDNILYCDGDVINGDIDGDVTDGNDIDGDVINGDVIDGVVIDGDVNGGDVIDGDITNSDVTDGDVIDDDVIDGDIDGDHDDPVMLLMVILLMVMVIMETLDNDDIDKVWCSSDETNKGKAKLSDHNSDCYGADNSKSDGVVSTTKNLTLTLTMLNNDVSDKTHL